jgi:hypothetical protein
MAKVQDYGVTGTPKNSLQRVADGGQREANQKSLSGLIGNVSRSSSPVKKSDKRSTRSSDHHTLPNAAKKRSESLLDTLPIRPDKANHDAPKKQVKKSPDHLFPTTEPPKDQGPKEQLISKQGRRKAEQHDNFEGIKNYYENAEDKRRAKRYARGLICRRDIEVKDGRALPVGYSCGLKNCKNCASHRANNQVKKYLPRLEKLDGPFTLVTLTTQTCRAEELWGQVREKRKIFSLIVAAQSKEYRRERSDWRYTGLLKGETTNKKCYYHYHFHFLMQGGEERAKVLIKEWMNRCKSDGYKVDRRGQHYRTTTASEGLTEVLKYCTKDATGKDKKMTHSPIDKQVVMLEAIERTRSLHPVNLPPIEEQIKAQEQAEAEEQPKGIPVPEGTPEGVYVFCRYKKRYRHKFTKEYLPSFEAPPEELQ